MGQLSPLMGLDPTIEKIVSEISEDKIAETLKKLESFETRNTLSDPNQPYRGIGARAMAKRLKGRNQKIEALLNNDIIGSEVRGNGISDNLRVLVFSEDPNDSPSRQIARYVKRIGERYLPEMTVEMVFRRDRFGRGGDHTAFNQENYAGVRFTTPNENFSNQHTATDTFANASPSYAARVTRINAAVAANMALAPSPPVTSPSQVAARSTQSSGNVTPGRMQSGRRWRGGPGLSRGSGYDAVLRWEYPDADPDLAGYVVVVRSTTANDWEREIWVGNVKEFTLKNTPIDELVFGVKAVDHDGHESPVSPYAR